MPLWNVLLTILPGGVELRFARRNFTIAEARTGRSYQYIAGIANITIPASTVPP